MLNKFSSLLIIALLSLAGIIRAEDKPSGTKLNDAQIAMIAVTANAVDVDAGKAALKKTTSDSVKHFAEMMIRDHSTVIKQATDLAKKLGVTPEDNETSRTLKSDGKTTREKLNNLSGAAFDKAYVDNEVAYHEAVLSVLDKTLIPNTSNAELKKLLETARPIISSHLDHAKMVQQSLSK
jgi:putative membrane protein